MSVATCAYCGTAVAPPLLIDPSGRTVCQKCVTDEHVKPCFVMYANGGVVVWRPPEKKDA